MTMEVAHGGSFGVTNETVAEWGQEVIQDRLRWIGLKVSICLNCRGKVLQGMEITGTSISLTLDMMHPRKEV